MRPSLVVVCAALAAAAAQFTAPEPLVSSSAASLTGVSRDATDINAYNVHDHGGNPLGILQEDTVSMRLLLGYRLLRLHHAAHPDSADQTANGFVVPEFLIGEPQRLAAILTYSISPLSSGVPASTLSMPLNRFGLTLLGQTASKRLSVGFEAAGIAGRERTDQGSSMRINLGVERVGLFLGSELDKLVRLALGGGLLGGFDSLETQAAAVPDRFGTITVPVLGVGIDVGTEGFPYLADFYFHYARNNFVYTTVGGDRNAIVGDSIDFHFKNMADLAVRDIMLRPAFHLGYLRVGHRRYLTTGDNYPIVDYDGENAGYDWKTSSFVIGLGAAAGYRTWGDGWIEYSHASLSLELGEQLGSNAVPAIDGYNRFGMGLEGNIHALPFKSFPPGRGAPGTVRTSCHDRKRSAQSVPVRGADRYFNFTEARQADRAK